MDPRAGNVFKRIFDTAVNRFHVKNSPKTGAGAKWGDSLAEFSAARVAAQARVVELEGLLKQLTQALPKA